MKKLALILAICAGSASHAQVTTGNDYYETCKDSPDILEVRLGWCVGFFAGAWEGTKSGAFRVIALVSEQSHTSNEVDHLVNQFLGVCVPDAASYTQMIDVFTKYLTENPATRDAPARALLVNALGEAFPCE